MPDDDDALAASRDGRAHVVGRRAGREPRVRSRLEAAAPREQLGRLACAQERARHDRLGPLGGEALGKEARLLPSVRRQPAKLVGMAGLGLRVADEVEAHGCAQHRRTLRCPECGGAWLDPGELSGICTEFASEEARHAAAGAYFDEVFGPELAAERAESQAELERSQHFARAFRLITPSYWLPGKQEGGAF